MSRPILSSQFFKKHAPQRDFYRRFESHYAWNQQVLPVYEWDGLLFIASDDSDLLETTPQDWPSHWVVVEASSQDLENLWVDFQEDSDSSQVSIHSSTQTSPTVSKADGSNTDGSISAFSEEDALPSIPELAAESPDLPIMPDIPNELDYEDLKEPSLKEAVSILKAPDAPSKLETLPELPDLEALMNADPTPLNKSKKTSTDPLEDLESLMNAEESLPPTPAISGEEGEEKLDMLEGLSANSAPIKLVKIAEPIIPAEEPLPELPAIPVAEAAEIPVPDIAVPEDTLPPIPRASLMKKPEIPGRPAVVHRELDELTPTPPPMIPTPKGSKLVLPASAMKGSELIPPADDTVPPETAEAVVAYEKMEDPMEAAAAPVVKIPDPAKTPPEINIPHEERLLLDQLPKFYQRSFLALKAGNSVRLVSWPREMSAEIASKDKDFSLNTPSPFRIALRTEKSYHGYLVQTPFMTQIFAAWNGGQYPETLTVIPVKSNQEIVGFVVCCGTKEADKKAGLQAAEKVAETIGTKWKKIGAQFAANAA